MEQTPVWTLSMRGSFWTPLNCKCWWMSIFSSIFLHSMFAQHFLCARLCPSLLEIPVNKTKSPLSRRFHSRVGVGMGWGVERKTISTEQNKTVNSCHHKCCGRKKMPSRARRVRLRGKRAGSCVSLSLVMPDFAISATFLLSLSELDQNN